MNWFDRILRVVMMLLATVLMLGIYMRQIEPNWFNVQPLTFRLPHLAPAFAGYKIVQITDIHINQWVDRPRLEKIVTLINQEKPDLVVLTGDYLSKKKDIKYLTLLGESLAEIKAPNKTLAILGNHDYWVDQELVTKILTKNGIRVLKNEVVNIRRQDQQLTIAGIDDIWSGKPDMAAILQAMGDRQGGILLAHEPDYADEAATTKKFDLQLSGHSHGGQVRIPLSERFLPYLGRKYPYGRYQIGEMTLYTNPGVGMTGLPIRFNARPEISSIVLQPSDQT